MNQDKITEERVRELLELVAGGEWFFYTNDMASVNPNGACFVNGPKTVYMDRTMGYAEPDAELLSLSKQLAEAYLSKCAEVRELETSVKRYNAERNHYREQYFDAMSREGKLRAEVRELRDRVRHLDQTFVLSSIQQKKVDILEEQGAKGSAVVVFMQSSNGDLCSVDAFGRVRWIYVKEAPTND